MEHDIFRLGLKIEYNSLNTGPHLLSEIQIRLDLSNTKNNNILSYRKSREAMWFATIEFVWIQNRSWKIYNLS